MVHMLLLHPQITANQPSPGIVQQATFRYYAFPPLPSLQEVLLWSGDIVSIGPLGLLRHVHFVIGTFSTRQSSLAHHCSLL